MSYHDTTKTPELDVVRIVSLVNSAVLLVKEVDDVNWKLPGGKIHSGETIIEAARREIIEELGLSLGEKDVLNYIAAPIPSSSHTRHILLVNLREPIKTTPEVEEARYFDLKTLPQTKFRGHITSAVELITS